MDKSQGTKKDSPGDFFASSGIPPKTDPAHAIAHNKATVIDGETVITGSFNFIKAAEENDTENLLVTHKKNLALLYTKNWQDHAQHSEVYA